MALAPGRRSEHGVPRGKGHSDADHRDLLEVDVYEVSVTASPMNNRTRVISTKSDDLSYEEFKERSLAVARAVPRQPTEQELAELRAESMALVREILPRPEQVEEA